MLTNPLFKHYFTRHEDVLRRLIAQASIPADRLKMALRYSLFSGGKRLRPILVYLCGEIVNAQLDSLDMIAAAIELIHCYSLIHDDLPAMDNDDFRRGSPTCHRAFDEATAILVGDGMQALASEILLKNLPQSLPLSQVILIMQELTSASGFSGMVSGQSLDLSELNQGNITEIELERIHQLKTGALFSSCINMALLAGSPDEKTITVLRQYATGLGIAFQMQDDYHDRYKPNDKLGKLRASDAANHKTTFASLFDQQELIALIDAQYINMQTGLTQIGTKATHLLDLTRFLHHRTARTSLWPD